MKISILVPVVILLISACKTPATTTTTVDKTVPVIPVQDTPVIKLNTLNDSASYAIGLSVINFYKQQGVNRLNTVLISKAINDVLEGKNKEFSDSTANVIMNRYMN